MVVNPIKDWVVFTVIEPPDLTKGGIYLSAPGPSVWGKVIGVGPQVGGEEVPLGSIVLVAVGKSIYPKEGLGIVRFPDVLAVMEGVKEE